MAACGTALSLSWKGAALCLSNLSPLIERRYSHVAAPFQGDLERRYSSDYFGAGADGGVAGGCAGLGARGTSDSVGAPVEATGGLK